MSNLARYGGSGNEDLGINLPNGDSFSVSKDSFLADLNFDQVEAVTGDACYIGQFNSEFDFNLGDEVAVNILKDTHSNWGFVQPDDTYLNDFLPGGDFEFGLEVIGEGAGIMPGDVGQASGLACNRASHYQLADEFSPYKDW